VKGKAMITWINRAFVGDGSRYDVLIDDAWVPNSGIVPLKPKCTYWSLKGNAMSESYSPYLHSTETRFFSHHGEGVAVACKCMVCTACAASSGNYEHYRFLRIMCTLLGHAPDCIRVGVLQPDALAVHNALRQIMTQPVFTAVRPADYRAVLALDGIVSMKVTGSHSVSIGEGDVQIVHKKGMVVANAEMPVSFDWLTGRKVAFFGVAPTLLGSTKIVPIIVHQAGRANRGGVDVAFYGTVEALCMNPTALTVYLPHLARGHPMLSSWNVTGRVLRSMNLQYDEYVKIQPVQQRAPTYISPQEMPALDLYPRVRDDYRTFYPLISPLKRMEVMSKPRPVKWCSITFEGDTLVVARAHSGTTLSRLLWRDDEGNYGFPTPISWDAAVSLLVNSNERKRSTMFIPSKWTKNDEFQFLACRYANPIAVLEVLGLCIKGLKFPVDRAKCGLELFNLSHSCFSLTLIEGSLVPFKRL